MATRVLVIDDSPLAQRQIKELVLAQDGFSVEATAANGLAGLELASARRPDLVTLDLHMPVMDGLTTLKHLMALRPVPTLVVSSFATEASHLTFDCLRYGAVGFVTKPSDAGSGLPGDHQQEIVRYLRQAASVGPARLRFERLRLQPPALPLVGRPVAKHLLVVVAGRSGLTSVLHVLGAMPRHPRLGVVVLLDAPPHVVDSFAEYARRFSGSHLTSRVHDAVLQGGTGYLVSTHTPLLLAATGSETRMKVYPLPTGADPSAVRAAFFCSLAECFSTHVSVALLSGTGHAFLDGLGNVVASGGSVLAQDPETALEPEVLTASLQRPATQRFATWEELAGKVLARVSARSPREHA